MDNITEQDDFKNNPLLASLWDIHKTEIIKDFHDCYVYSRKIFGEKFDECMRSVAEELLLMQSKCTPGTSVLTCAMVLVMPQEDDEEEDLEQIQEANKFIKGCAIWLLLNKKAS